MPVLRMYTDASVRWQHQTEKRDVFLEIQFAGDFTACLASLV